MLWVILVILFISFYLSLIQFHFIYVTKKRDHGYMTWFLLKKYLLKKVKTDPIQTLFCTDLCKVAEKGI